MQYSAQCYFPVRCKAVTGLRQRKRERTRAALVTAAKELFTERGYDQTTVADIAAQAEVGTRTFFTYFKSKDELLFPDAAARVAAALAAIEQREPSEGPVDVLLRALNSSGVAQTDLVSDLAALRLRLIREVPAVRGRALQLQLDAQREIARSLHAAYPDEYDLPTASALVGAYLGAVAGALDALLDSNAAPRSESDLRALLSTAVRTALYRASGTIT